MNTTAQDEITAYVDAVREALAGLPTATRDELVEDLPEHLAEVLAEGDGPLIDRLGDPWRYAAELCAAAGIVAGTTPPPAARHRELYAAGLRRLRAVDSRVGPVLGYPRASDFFALLRPAWWVLRGYLAAMVLAHLLDDSGQPIGLLPRIGGSEPVALLLLVGVILASVWLGRRTATLTPWPRYALRAGTLLLALVALTGFVNADSDTRGAGYAPAGYDNPYAGVSDVYAYDRQGHLLTGVQLFDQDGHPIRMGNPWCGDTANMPGGDGQTYPYCPQNAPWPLLPEMSRSAQPAPSDEPTEPAPPSVSPSAPPSASPSPQPAGSDPSALPSPSASR